MEIKLLLGCTEVEIALILSFLNGGDAYQAMVIRRGAV
jgi:hypothetical protein